MASLRSTEGMGMRDMGDNMMTRRRRAPMPGGTAGPGPDPTGEPPQTNPGQVWGELPPPPIGSPIMIPGQPAPGQPPTVNPDAGTGLWSEQYPGSQKDPQPVGLPAPPGVGGDQTFAKNKPNPYQDGSTVNLPGWDNKRTDNDGKYEYGRAVQQALGRGETYNADWVRKFVNDNADEWELDPQGSAGDPHIRQKQSWLDDPSHGDGKTGQTSIFQDVLGDSGGANRPQFGNVEGDPSKGYAAPTTRREPSPVGGGGLGGPHVDQTFAHGPILSSPSAMPGSHMTGDPQPGTPYPPPSGGSGDHNPNLPPPGAPGDSGHGGLDEILNGLLGGGLNKDIINRRVDSARGDLERNLKSSTANQDAALAERGLIGSGAEATALSKLHEQGQDSLNSSVNDIYANESQNADSRMMQALTTKAGLSVADAKNMVDMFNAQTGRSEVEGNLDLGGKRLALDDKLGTGGLAAQNRGLDIQHELGSDSNNIARLRANNDFTLGKGGLDLQRRGLDINEALGGRGLDLTEQGQQLDWNKFLANFGLDREKFGAEQGSSGDLMTVLQMLYGGAGQAAGGHY